MVLCFALFGLIHRKDNALGQVGPTLKCTMLYHARIVILQLRNKSDFGIDILLTSPNGKYVKPSFSLLHHGFVFAAPFSLISTSQAQRTLEVKWTQPEFIYAATNGSDSFEARIYSNTTVNYEVTCTSGGSPTLSSKFQLDSIN